MKMYHVTNIANMGSIVEEGLKIGKSGGIYLTSDWEDLLQVDVELRSEKIAVFEVTIHDEDTLIVDHEFDNLCDDWVWYVKYNIPPKDVKLLLVAQCYPIGTGVKIYRLT